MFFNALKENKQVPSFLKKLRILSTLVLLSFITFSIAEYVIIIDALNGITDNIMLIDVGFRRASEFAYALQNIRHLIWLQEYTILHLYPKLVL
jgi:hypothetical protein